MKRFWKIAGYCALGTGIGIYDLGLNFAYAGLKLRGFMTLIIGVLLMAIGGILLTGKEADK